LLALRTEGVRDAHRIETAYEGTRHGVMLADRDALALALATVPFADCRIDCIAST